MRALRSKLHCFTLSLVLVSSIVFNQSALAYELPRPQLIAVYFWASWCPNCKVLSPILDEARNKGQLDKKPVLFVKLDLSDSSTIHQSVMLAQALGIAPYVQSQGSSTGYVALLSADSQKELQRFDRSATPAQIVEEVTKPLMTLSGN